MGAWRNSGCQEKQWVLAEIVGASRNSGFQPTIMGASRNSGLYPAIMGASRNSVCQQKQLVLAEIVGASQLQWVLAEIVGPRRNSGLQQKQWVLANYSGSGTIFLIWMDARLTPWYVLILGAIDLDLHLHSVFSILIIDWMTTLEIDARWLPGAAASSVPSLHDTGQNYMAMFAIPSGIWCQARIVSNRQSIYVQSDTTGGGGWERESYSTLSS